MLHVRLFPPLQGGIGGFSSMQLDHDRACWGAHCFFMSSLQEDRRYFKQQEIELYRAPEPEEGTDAAAPTAAAAPPPSLPPSRTPARDAAAAAGAALT